MTMRSLRVLALTFGLRIDHTRGFKLAETRGPPGATEGSRAEQGTVQPGENTEHGEQVSRLGNQAPEQASKPADGLLFEELGRPQFHFTATQNWLNDPNGLVYYKGKYHLFFQHNPLGRQWGNMSWGHAESPDLFHWRQLRNALVPDSRGDIWSGSAVVDWDNSSGLQLSVGKPPLVAFYTLTPGRGEHGQPFEQHLAFSQDEGLTWTRLGSPVVEPLPCESLECPWARDPKVVRQGGRWLMALYLKDSTFALFSSGDLRSWQRVQELTLPDSHECPDLFELPGGHWVFWSAGGRYLLGSFRGGHFVRHGPPGAAEHGDAYAGQTFSDAPDGRRLQVSWLRGCHWDTAFNQQLSVPVELDLVQLPSGLYVRRRPVAELAGLRRLPALLTPQQRTARTAIGGAGVELRLTGRFMPDSTLGIVLLGREVFLGMDSDRHGAMHVRGGERSLQRPADSVRTMPVHVDSRGLMNVSVLADRRSLELYDMAGGASMALCALLPHENGEWRRDLGIRVDAGDVEVEHLEAYELGSALPRVTKGANQKVGHNDLYEVDVEQLVGV